MAQRLLETRRKRHFALAAQLGAMDNARLLALLGDGEPMCGRGRTHTLEIGGAKVFVKRVPVTDLENAHYLSTRNLYDLPTFYNFGVGSAGLGVWRELVAHIKTTAWVLDGQIEGFPLTYHHRVVPFHGERAAADPERHQQNVDYWAGNENIGRYLLDRAAAQHELVLFLEHIPHVLGPWLRQNQSRVDAVLNDLRGTLDFLRRHGMIHFDAHFENVLTDGRRTYLTDFGLVLDRRFDLTEPERAFFRAHTHYDCSEVLACLLQTLHQTFEALPESDRLRLRTELGIAEDARSHSLAVTLLRHLETVAADLPTLHPRYADCLIRHRDTILLGEAFFSTLSGNPRKDTKFPHARLRRLLDASGFLPATLTSAGRCGP